MKNKNKNFHLIENFKNLSLVLASILFSIYMLEIAYALYQVSSYKFNKWSTNKLNRYDVYKDYKDSGKDAVVVVTAENYISDHKAKHNFIPLAGISNKFTISCNELGFWTTYHSDRYGFNNPDEMWNRSYFDFVLIGDSFTHGSCVREKDTISGQLKKFGKVLNLGYPGNGPLVEYATLREYFKNNLKSKYVLWFYYGNDSLEVEKEISNNILIKYLKDKNFTQDLINNQKKIDYVAKNLMLKKAKKHENKKNILIRFDEINLKEILFLQNLRHRLSWMFKVNLMRSTSSDKSHQEIKENIINFSKILFNANKLVEENNSEMYFVYLPKYPGVYNDYNYSIYEKVIETVSNLNIPIIDFYPIFSSHPDPKSLFPLRRFGHYNEKGYKLIVETAINKIK
tara:strand:+ start:80 stop:1273 length:1194 start_codon:yes stop_codon:yes gene_type:complete